MVSVAKLVGSYRFCHCRFRVISDGLGPCCLAFRKPEVFLCARVHCSESLWMLEPFKLHCRPRCSGFRGLGIRVLNTTGRV